MFQVTPAAEAHLAGMLAEASAPEDTAVRLVNEEDRLRLEADNPQPQDTTFEHDGRTVLVVDPRVAELLDGHTLGVEEGDEGTQLALSRQDEEEE